MDGGEMNIERSRGRKGLQMAIRRVPGDCSAEWVLLVHGLGCSLESWESVIASPLFQDRPLLAVDLPGHGGSASCPGPGPGCTLQAHAAAVAEVIEEVGIERLHLVGHSMGGAIGLLLAGLLGPGRLISFCNVEGNLVGKDCGTSRRIAEKGRDEFVNGMFVKLLAAMAADPDASNRAWGAMVSRCDPAAFHASSVSLVEWSDSGMLPGMFYSLACRKLYVHGSRSVDFLGGLGGIGANEKAVIHGAGHFVMQDRPAEFCKMLHSFIVGESGVKNR